MKAEGQVKPKWLFSQIFEPAIDFYALLTKQSQTTLAGVQALVDWLDDGEDDTRQRVLDLETQADHLKLDLARKLTDAFITPFDREDIYELSIRMDEIINSAKAVVREIQAFDVDPKRHTPIRDMALLLHEGIQCLSTSMGSLRANLPEASRHAYLARKSENRINKAYRQAMKELFLDDDLKEILRVKEVYKTLLLGGEHVDYTAERLLYAIVKMG